MKKLLVLIMALVLACGTLTACGGSDTGATDKTIRVAAFKGAYGEEYLAGIKSAFEEAYSEEGYKIEYEAKQNIEETIRPQVQQGEGPDVIYLPTKQGTQYTENLIKTKSMVALDDVLDMKIKGEDVKLRDKILPDFIDNNDVRPYRDGKLYMLPLFYSPLGLYYNKALFNADGSDGKYKLPETWDDMDALKQRLDQENEGKNDREKRYLFAYGNSGYMAEFIFSAVAAKSGTTKLKDLFGYEESYIGSEEFTDVLNKIAGLKGYVYPGSWDSAKNYKENQETLLLNKALFLPCGTWLPTEMEDKQMADGFEYGFTSNLAFASGSDRYAHAKIEQVYILKQSQKQDIAKAFVSFLFSDKAAHIIAKDAKALTPTVNALTIAKENKYIPEQILGFYDIYAEGAKLSVGNFLNANVAGLKWSDVFTGNVNKILSSNYTVEEWQQELKTNGIKLKAAIK